MKKFNVLLFDDFETLDAFRPAEIIGKLTDEYDLDYYSLEGGLVTSTQKLQVKTYPISKMNDQGILLIPGGKGTRRLVNDSVFISSLEKMSIKAPNVLSVCTGSALLSKTGLLNERHATSNKKAFEWVQSVNQSVNWVKKARWVIDGKYYTSSGISAGMDMTLGFISDFHGEAKAQFIADSIEYSWNSDKNIDPFAR